MIAALLNLLILVVVCGLLILGLFWIVETFFRITIPLVVKQAVGIIALLLIALYLLRIFGVA
jgi:plastocyanin domain-containing protein